jgi:tRNA-dihydrouridine synthase A
LQLNTWQQPCSLRSSACLQVIERYCKYADGMVGRWFVNGNGYKSPSIRTLVKPLLNLFHGEKRNKHWKAKIDQVLLEKPGPQSVTEVMQRTLHVLEDSALDAPPEAAVPQQELFSSESTGEWPPVQLPPSPVPREPAPVPSTEVTA